MSVKIKENRGLNEHKINELKANPPDNTLSLQRWRILKEVYTNSERVWIPPEPKIFQNENEINL